MIDDFLLHLFHEGNCLTAYQVFGSHIQDDNTIRFTVYAPHAKKVEVIGEWNHWDGSKHEMQRYQNSGVFTICITDSKVGMLYKYRIYTETGEILDKADPYAFYSEVRPGTASRTYDMEGYQWNDHKWLQKRSKNFDQKMNIYEVHFGSWRMKKEPVEEENMAGEFYTYEELITILIPYVKEMGYTHIELLPLLEHPFDGSWGYQATGFFSITSRYGTPKQFMKFIDACHQENIGIIMDFVPTHLVKDSHGLYRFDGGYVYEYPDENRRYSEWDSVYFDIGNNQVRSFLMSSVDFLLTYFHIDGIRYDAISHFVYWKGKKENGLNDGGISFLQHMNALFGEKHPTVMLMAEDSSDYPMVTKHPCVGGLGFDYKWDLGWMNDTLRYMSLNPIHRQYHHHLLTFSMSYFYQENYILPLSHDEVVHGKKTILDKMWGNPEQKMAQLKTLYMYMMMHPGKKLNFMGNEIAEYREWDESKSLGWNILLYPSHDSFYHYVQELHQIYHTYTCMYHYDYYPEGFEWLVVDDHNQGVFAWERSDPSGSRLVVVFNFTGNRHQSYRIPINIPGKYREIVNSDQDIYAGNHDINEGLIQSEKGYSWHKELYLPVVVAPFSCMLFALEEIEILET
ncbi:MAG: 1,4-alpha-glucan branching protein GlgB [Coprobacillaceae bacterium]